VDPAVSQRRRVGATTLELPAFGFGAAHLGELYRTVDETDSRATLETAWAAGVRYFDTAPFYGRGLSEHRVGGFLRTRPREEFAITTKVGRILHRPHDPRTFDRSPWIGGLNFDLEYDYSYDGIMRSYEQSLQRLALDTVDALVIHDLDTQFHADALPGHERALRETGLKAIEDLKSAGDIRAYGMGINRSETLDAIGTELDLDFVIVAMPYTLLDQAILHTGMANCVRRGVSVIIGAPFASGILVTGSGGDARYAYGQASPEVQARVRGLEAVCRTHDVPLPAAALQFPLAHPAVVSIIPGAVRPTEVTQNIAAFEMEIPAAFWADLKSADLIDGEAPVPEVRPRL
jgi:D-threo-aldose 1-dehydrogenase